MQAPQGKTFELFQLKGDQASCAIISLSCKVYYQTNPLILGSIFKLVNCVGQLQTLIDAAQFCASEEEFFGCILYHIFVYNFFVEIKEKFDRIH